MSRRRGHFCWACGRLRPNEAFSGRNHARHLCRDCSRLGQEELSFRQGVRGIERCLTFDGMVRWKQRRHFASFLTHRNPRLRAYAEEVQRRSEAEREAARAERQAWLAEEEARAERVVPFDPADDEADAEDSCGGDIPF